MFNTHELYESILFISLGSKTEIYQARLIAAGNINQGIYLETNRGSFFLKTNFDPQEDIFEKEADGLKILAAKCSLQVPEVYHHGKINEQNFLLMEWISPDKPNGAFWHELGLGLAQLHLATTLEFGYPIPNYIASIPQQNTQNKSWVNFFIHQRLEPLIGRAYYEGMVDHSFLKRFQAIYPLLENFFPQEKPALLHGDLWSGNIMRGKSGSPVLIDPAVYFGHREMDLAFSRLFGGFDEKFYQAYQTAFPLEQGFEERIPVYNLYPLLVHLLLFGTSYLSGIARTVRKLLG